LYLTCLHWSVAQLTLGGHDVVAVNSLERAMTVVATLFGWIAGSTLVSCLSAVLMGIRMNASERHEQSRILKFRCAVDPGRPRRGSGELA